MTRSTSERTVPAQRDAFVWVWLPGHINPVVAGRVHFQRHSHRYVFGYERSYLDRPDADQPLHAGAAFARRMANTSPQHVDRLRAARRRTRLVGPSA
jgi:hypothetical protein